ncbi:MAG: hypothetical protein ACFFAN_07225 [Promethearchaeota archaeon]
MKQLKTKLINTLKRINFIFKNEEIYTECIRDFDGFSILGEKFSFLKGKNYKLKFFIAKMFIKNNILKVAPNEKCDNIDVQRYAIAERDDQKFLQQSSYFLNKIKEFKSFVEKDVKDGIRPKLDLERFNSYTLNIIDSRLLKLLRLAKAELTLEDEQKLTYSEKVLYEQMYKLIKIWRNFFTNINKENSN